MIGPFYDRVKETTTTTGTGTITLNGAQTGYQSFAAVGNGNTCYYCIADQSGNNWETGYGTYSTTGPTLSRTVVLASSNSGSLVSFTAGTKDVFISAPADFINEDPYWRDMAALLDPMALVDFQTGTFTYSAVNKYLMYSWNTSLASGSGRIEVRDIQYPIGLNGNTVYGLLANPSGSTAQFLDPTLPVDYNPRKTYYSRLATLNSSPLQYQPILGDSSNVPLLPGPYGSILRWVMCMDMTWVIFGPYSGYGFNVGMEISDTAIQRMGKQFYVPINKGSCSSAGSGATASGGSPKGGFAYYICPSTWSKVPDSNVYQFRDDFMGSSLNTSITWNRQQSTTGNVEISTQFQWLKMQGDGTWGDNAIYTKSYTFPRSAGYSFVCDVFLGNQSGGSQIAVGCGTGAGYSYTNISHGMSFGGDLNLYIVEDGSARNSGTPVGTLSQGATYRVKITPNPTNQTATYNIQGGVQYPPIGGASWSTFNPSDSSSATNTFRPTASCGDNNSQPGYISDVRVF